MNPLIRFVKAALPAAALALCLGCDRDEGPGYLKKPGEAPPLSADEHAAAAAEDRAVADAERAEAAKTLPTSRGKPRR